MKLLGSTKTKITKNKNGENAPYLKLLKLYQYIVILLIIISKIQESCAHLFLTNRLVSYQIFHPKILLLNTFDSEFSYIKVSFTEQNSKSLEIECNLSGKYSQKLIDHANQYATDALENASKRATQKAAEATVT